MFRVVIAWIVPLVLLCGCVIDEPAKPIETLLDKQSAVTVEAMGVPYVLAHEAGALAANARDYLDLRFLEVDQMGKRTYLLSLVAFSTVDRRGIDNPTVSGLGRIRLRVGKQVTDLSAVPAGDNAHGLSDRLFERRNGQFGSAEYLVTPQLIRSVAQGSPDEFSLTVGDGADDLRYAPWEPAREGLSAFAARLPEAHR